MASFAVNLYLMKRLFSKTYVPFSSPASCINMSSSVKDSIGTKPPNVLVYKHEHCTGNFVPFITRCLPSNKFVVYDLTCDRLCVDPWIENARLLIIPSDVLETSDDKSNRFSTSEINQFKKYMICGGKILNFSHHLVELSSISVSNYSTGIEILTLTGTRGTTGTIHLPKSVWTGHGLEQSQNTEDCSLLPVLTAGIKGKENVIVAMKCSDNNTSGQILHCMVDVLKQNSTPSPANVFNLISLNLVQHCLSELGLPTCNEEESVVEIKESACFLFCEDYDSFNKFFSRLGVESSTSYVLKGSPSLEFISADNINDECPQTTESLIPVIYNHGNNESRFLKFAFNWTHYLEHLKSKHLGKIVLYCDIVTSTMDIVEPFLHHISDDLSVVAIAQQQTSGKGRGGNKWLSPLGCAMFSLALSIPLQSRLGQHLSILQHITTVAVVHGICRLPELTDLDLRVKWPNDIYFGAKTKIGGVLIKSTIFGNQCVATIGCGVNVSNADPTTCINSIIQAIHPKYPRVNTTMILATTISCLEELIENYQNEGDKSFLSLYYRYWIHSNSDVQVQIPSSVKGCMTEQGSNHRIADATVVGIDESGFLRVAMKNDSVYDNKIISLQPDGNSFDITKNLIAIKNTL